jgi:hypothetical protein
MMVHHVEVDVTNQTEDLIFGSCAEIPTDPSLEPLVEDKEADGTVILILWGKSTNYLCAVVNESVNQDEANRGSASQLDHLTRLSVLPRIFNGIGSKETSSSD